MKRKNVITKIIVVSLICLLVSTTARAELFSEEQETLEGVEFVAEEQPDEPETEAGNEKPEFLSRSYDLDPVWVEFIQGLNDMVMQDQDQDLFEGALVIDLEEKTVLNEKQEEVFEYSELIQQVLEQGVENLLEQYGSYYDPVTHVLRPVHVTLTYPYRVSSDVTLVGYYYGYLPWGVQ